ncbi:preprotein translocase subunit SecY [Thermospira aquatica]|uniref:Protein translocase subunit SecY n=1 Tax=Thermospira aquatica TaxID=2828656 RepID=A0AAX3BA20_9SPIR|nr:preprotein translocase subunit SecY [Thermospira aquatica]URA09057.1 preprotein translocase subunit SecY [Thermospira aquatica]
MIKAFLNIFKIEDLRKRFLFLIGMLVVYRIGAHIPVPGVDLGELLANRGFFSEGAFGNLMNLFSGGARENISIFSLGIMPYITAMIIMQLLKAIFPSLDKEFREGPEGRRKFLQYSRYGTVLVTLIQGFLYARSLVASAPQFILSSFSPVAFIIVFSLTVTAGTLVLLWMGEQITERGIGNGVSIIIMAGIIARLPRALIQLVLQVQRGTMDPMNLIIVLGLFFLVIALVVFEEQALRHIPIQHTRRAGGAQGIASSMPFKINPTGVIPIIFGSSIMMFFTPIFSWLRRLWDVPFMRSLETLAQHGNSLYNIVYFLFILFFAYFYLEVELNPHDIAEDLRRRGDFIPGVRPGTQTEDYIAGVLYRLTLPGAIFIGVIALLPTFILRYINIPAELAFLMGGTSLIIMVNVALETLKQIESQLLMHRMDGFIEKRSLRSK